MVRKFFLGFLWLIQLNAVPKVTIVLVIDQFGEEPYLQLHPYLSHGIKNFLTNGTVYTQAYLPYGAPATAVGHASIGTGALPKDHGIVANQWRDNNENPVALEDNNGKNIMLPTLNAPFLAANKNNKALAISLKARAAFGMGGKKAAVIWFDEKTGQFQTNSNALLINHLVAEFNNKIQKISLRWQPTYSDERYYQFPHINNYEYASESSIVGTDEKPKNPAAFSERFFKLPIANQVLLDMAAMYIQNIYPQLGDGNLLVWVSLSSLDKIGHIYGPDSREAIDMVYALDKQIEQFMTKVAKTAPSDNTLYVLTADHGIMSIPELIKKEHPSAKRIALETKISKINKKIAATFGYKDAITCSKTPHIIFNKKLMQKLSPDQKKELLKFAQVELKKVHGIQNVYTAQELQEMNPAEGTIPWLFKNSIYPGRSGDLLIEIEPYSFTKEKYKGGAKHNTPYSYNTHVPLIIYPAKKPQKVTEKVWMPQITATLAKKLEVPTPSPYALPPLPAS